MNQTIHNAGFVFLDDSIRQDLIYASTHNFTGAVVPGYIATRAILTKQAAKALFGVENQLRKQGYALLVKDTYRPNRAVQFFKTEWKNMPDHPEMKRYYYPDLTKPELFENSYIAKHYSRHSSGSTVDLTVIDINTNKELDMGTPLDFLGTASNVGYSGLTADQQKNRALLSGTMKQNGFREMTSEWWHFTLTDEPFENKAFDFVYDDEGKIISGDLSAIAW
jgi:D-alanyl-D-alanine dipeptidase